MAARPKKKPHPAFVPPRKSTRERAVPRQALSLDQAGGANPADAPTMSMKSIMAQYRATGTVPALRKLNPLYGDFTGSQDLQDQMNRVQDAQEIFDGLPSAVRKLCNNNPAELLDLVEDEEGRVKLHDAGLELLSEEEIAARAEEAAEAETPPSAASGASDESPAGGDEATPAGTS